MSSYTDAAHREYRKEKVGPADEFEDFVQVTLHRTCGISLCNFKSRKYQFEVGENLAGFEIKRDGKYGDTRNLFIEVREKAVPSRPEWTPSGIYRPDNSWLYVIGDEARFWIFSKRMLRLLHKDGRYHELEGETGTSVGFLVPVTDANRFAAMVVDDGEPEPPRPLAVL